MKEGGYKFVSFLDVHGLHYFDRNTLMKRLTKTDWSYCAQFEGKYDGEAVNCGMYDKMEIEAVRRFLWCAGKLTLVPLSLISLITVCYQHASSTSHPLQNLGLYSLFAAH